MYFRRLFANEVGCRIRRQSFQEFRTCLNAAPTAMAVSPSLQCNTRNAGLDAMFSATVGAHYKQRASISIE
jgi:hypothetical protein